MNEYKVTLHAADACPVAFKIKAETTVNAIVDSLAYFRRTTGDEWERIIGSLEAGAKQGDLTCEFLSKQNTLIVATFEQLPTGSAPT